MVKVVDFAAEEQARLEKRKARKGGKRNGPIGALGLTTIVVAKLAGKSDQGGKKGPHFTTRGSQ